MKNINNNLLSIVIPSYNSAEIIPVLIEEIEKTLQDVNNKFEILYILDGSKDNSFEVLSNIANNKDWIKVIDLSRNFGHQAALTAGLKYASGKNIIVID